MSEDSKLVDGKKTPEKSEWLWGKPKESVRRVEIGFESPHIDNTATTSKYTVLSFFPLALFGQFRRFANMYFLLVGLLMYFGETTGLFLSPYPAATTLGPLALVVAVSLLQEALTDLARHRADGEVNSRPTDVVNPPEQVPQYKVKTGKIVRVINGDQIPADLIILATSTEANSCYIDTASIDGETSLKIRRAPQLENPLPWMTEPAPKDEHQLHTIMENLEGVVECDPPNEHINSFTGTLKLAERPDELVPLGKDHVVLRGSSLHTDWILGLAVYTGEDTKLALNARTPPQKLSRLDRVSNSVVIAIFVCQIALALLTAGLQQSFEDDEFKNLWYVGFQNNKQIQRSSYLEDSRWPDLDFSSSRQSFGWSFCTFLILYVNFIPLSLYVSLEMCFLVLVLFVNMDIMMYHAPTNTPALARSPTITDLGQVQYIFSDKTGTLTRNEMKLRRIIVHGVVYAVPEEEEKKSASENNDDSAEKTDAINKKAMPQTPGGKEVLGDEGLPVVDELARRACEERDEYAACILESLMLCNTVVVENKNDKVKYQAESPDEGALVNGGAQAGYKLSARTEHVLAGETPALNGARRSWQILATNEFDNDRKRMSIFVRELFDDEHAPQREGRPMLSSQPSLKSTKGNSESNEGGASLRGKVLLLCKGADNSMLASAAPTNLDGLDEMRQKLDEFARQGLRTLVFGVRIYEEEEYEAWHSEFYAPAISSLHDREGMLKKAASAAERMLTIVGATAIEDKLQIGVPETIATLAKAGIKLWVLTGDKRETAIEIGKSCRLLRPGMPLAVLSSKASLSQLKGALLKLYDLSGASPAGDIKNKKERVAVEEKLEELRGEKLRDFGDCDVWTNMKNDTNTIKALVIDGEAMTQLFGDRAIEMILFGVLSKCGSVIACRVTPKQKAQLVKLVQEHVKPTPVTLAIGDGANDVNMIMSAQVGVGISGHEGLQAVNASDFAIAQFRYLLRLLLVHGRWGYRRVCILINFSFYKNACLAATLFIYTNYTGYSGTSLFSDYFTALFNFFLFLMIFYTAIFDQDVDAAYVMKHPQLYASGRCNYDLNVKMALTWIFLALIHAAIIFFVPAGALKLGTGDRTDLVSYEAFGAVVSCGFINYMNLKVLFETRYFTYPLSGAGKKGGHVGIFASTWFAAIFNVVFFYLGLIVASLVGDATTFIFQMLPFWNVGTTVLGHSSTWAITFLVVAACTAVDFIKYAITIFFFPSPIAVSIERCRLIDNAKAASSSSEARNNNAKSDKVHSLVSPQDDLEKNSEHSAQFKHLEVE